MKNEKYIHIIKRENSSRHLDLKKIKMIYYFFRTKIKFKYILSRN